MNDNNLQERINGISRLIGNTPLLAINCTYKGKERTVYAKAEFLNLTGSIKDRMAFHILNKAYSEGILKAGDRIVEATSGNTGIAFSGVGRALGHPVTIFMPNWMSQERKNLIKSFGANIVLVSPEEGGFLGSIDMANKLAQTEENCYLPRQFSNTDNCQAHYNTTAQELCNQLKTLDLKPDAFVAGVGTGGTVMGVGRYLHQQNPDVKIYPLEPSNSPTMSTGHKVGKHRIQGISDEFIPAIVDLNKLDDIISVDDGDAIIMAQKLSKGLGLGVGISSGGNFLGALKAQDILGTDAVVATVFADDNKKYLSTDLMNEEPIKEDFLSSDVKLNYYSCIQRCCILHNNYVSNLGV
ncbi:MAG: PLP-dependent cysteine synthase family protein [Bacteroidales bacterium]